LFARGDEYFAKTIYFLYGGSNDEIFEARDELATLSERPTGLSEESPYIAELSSDDIFRNVMGSFQQYLATLDSGSFANITSGDDGWPTTADEFVSALVIYSSFKGQG